MKKGWTNLGLNKIVVHDIFNKCHPSYTYGGDFKNNNKAFVPLFKESGMAPTRVISYCPINHIEGDMYLGSGAGKRMIADIKNAQHSIRIISPYLSPSMIDILVDKHQKDHCSAALITGQGEASVDDPIGQGYLVQKLISQNIDRNEALKKHKDAWSKRYEILIGIVSVTLAFSLIGGMHLLLNNGDKTAYWLFLFGTVCFISLILLYFQQKTNQLLKVCTFTYEPLFDFKILSKSVHSPLVHQKIYLIDERVAYLGSLNFTQNGCNYNLESSIKITNQSAIKIISDYFNELLMDNTLPFYSMDELRKMYFTEDYYK